MDQKDIRRLLEEKAKDVVPVSVTLKKINYEEVTELKGLHNLSFSALVDTAIEMALSDPYYNGEIKLKGDLKEEV